MKKYDVIAFDQDGTLSDPEQGLVDAFIYAFKKMGVTDYGDRESLRRFIGPSLYVVWQDEFGFNEKTVVDAIEKFREYYLYLYSVLLGSAQWLRGQSGDIGIALASADVYGSVILHRLTVGQAERVFESVLKQRGAQLLYSASLYLTWRIATDYRKIFHKISPWI